MKRLITVLIAVTLVYCCQSAFLIPSHGASPYIVEIIPKGASGARAGESINLEYEIKNRGQEINFDSISLNLSPWAGDVTGGIGHASRLAINDTVAVSFNLTVDKSIESGNRYVNLVIRSGSNVLLEQLASTVAVNGEIALTGGAIKSPSLDYTLDHRILPSDGFKHGNNNEVCFEFIWEENYGIENCIAEITLPAGVGPFNSGNTKRIGYVRAGSRNNIKFPIFMDKSVTSSFCNLQLTIKGNTKNGQEVSIKRDFYVPVQTYNSKSPIDDIFIKNIETPKGIESNKNFQMSFDVTNGGKEKLKNLKVTAEMPEGLINKSQNTFVDSFAAGQTRKYSITMSATDPATKSYGIKISATDGEKSGGGNISQYASVYVGGGSGGKVKTPQLMIADYSYGGTYVQTNSPFRLNLKFLNTSGKTISNVKVKLTAAEGTFIPVNASNSFYMDRIGSKETSDHSIMMRAKPDAAQKTTGIDVEMTYEDGSGNEFTTKDVVSIPITQETKIRVDDIISPVDIFPQNPVGVSVQFYNMGKSVLNNLRATAYGDFETVDSINYFVGNMEAGKSDTYDFTIVPKKQGVLEGAVVFTYEDGKGVEQSFEKPFTFNVAEAMPDMGIMPEEPIEKKVNLKIPAICTGILLILLTAWILLYRLHKKKLRLGE